MALRVLAVVGADGGRLFLAKDLARYQLNRAGELVHVGDGKTG